jgi:hypothetical protein
MKTLSIRQPWATAILRLGKDVENRRWSTSFRGRILIHASKQIDLDACRQLNIDPSTLQTASILGSVEIIDCIRNSSSSWAEPNSCHWILARPEEFKNPIPCAGQSGLWEFPLALIPFRA